MKKLTDKEANGLQREIDHILDSGANSLRFLNMFDKFLERRSKNTNYAIEKLKVDLKHETANIWELRHKVHPSMTTELIKMAKEISNAIKTLNKS